MGFEGLFRKKEAKAMIAGAAMAAAGASEGIANEHAEKAAAPDKVIEMPGSVAVPVGFVHEGQQVTISPEMTHVAIDPHNNSHLDVNPEGMPKMTINPTNGEKFSINPTNGEKFTINATSGEKLTVNPTNGEKFTINPTNGKKFTINPVNKHSPESPQ